MPIIVLLSIIMKPFSPLFNTFSGLQESLHNEACLIVLTVIKIQLSEQLILNC